MWKFTLICFFIFAIGCKCERAQNAASQKSSNYNLVLICIDNLRADHMGLYGYKRNTTPYLDEWASKEQIFQNFYSTTHMTIPSEGSVFTGRYPFENGLLSFEHTLWPQIDTITSILSKQGYKTLAYGNSAEYRTFPTVESSFRRFFDEYQIFKRLGNKRILRPEGIDKFLENVGSNNFFIWIPMGTVHSPYGYPFKNTFSDKDYNGPMKPFETFNGSNFWVYKNVLYPITPETNFNFGSFEKNLVSETNSKQPIALKPADLNWLLDRYDDGIIQADTQFKNIMKVFENRDLLKNTIFVVYSNHGEELNEHGYFGHFDIYQGNIHTPLIIKTPNLTVAKRHSMLASSVDILPTVLKVMGLPEPASLDGLDLFSPPAAARSEIFLMRTPLWESLLRLYEKPSIWDDFRTIATEDYMEPVILTEQYKLIHRRARFINKKYSAFQKTSGKKLDFPEYEMYDLKNDPLEQKNQAFVSKAFAPLKQKLEKFETRILSKKKDFLKAKSVIQDYQ